MRRPNENQNIEEFKFLGHVPIPKVYFPDSANEVRTFTCVKCRGDLGTNYGCNPCGDPNGNSIERITTPDRYVYKGRDL